MSRHSRYLRTFSQSRGHFKFLAQRPLFGTFENLVWVDQTEFQSPRNIKRDTEDLMGGNVCLVRSHTHTHTDKLDGSSETHQNIHIQ